MKIYTLLCILGLAFFSCENSFIEKEPANSPETNFEIFWKEFDEYFALFEVKNVDWQNEYNLNRPLIHSTTTNNELWDICTQMIEKLDDSHTFMVDFKEDVDLFNENNKFFLSGGAAREHAEKEFSRTLVKEKYLSAGFQLGRDTAVTYGLINNKNIAYIHFGDMLGSYPQDIQKIVEGYKNTNGYIVDIRSNDGGNPDYAFGAAGAFSDGEHFIFTVQSKNGPLHNDFDAPLKKFTKEPNGFKYLKPVVLITDRQTISAGEDFCFNMRAFEHVYHIGDNTAGAQSCLSPIRTLPNGWAFGFSYQKLLDHDGRSYESIGIAPDFLIMNAEADINSGIDKVLEYAIDYLE